VNSHILNIGVLFKDIIVSPRRAFARINSEKFNFDVGVVFFLGSVPPLIKSFSVDSAQFTFFNDSNIDAFISLINNPKIVWLLHYLSFFAYISVTGFLCRVFFPAPRIKKLLFSFMAISGAGMLMQIGFIFLRLFLPEHLHLYYGYLTFFWCSFLAVMAIKQSQNGSLKRAVIVFVLTTIPFLFVFGSGGIFPSIAWLMA
jgi:hypothetical protein